MTKSQELCPFKYGLTEAIFRFSPSLRILHLLSYCLQIVTTVKVTRADSPTKPVDGKSSQNQEVNVGALNRSREDGDAADFY